MKSKVEIGKEFEKEAYEYLKINFDKVEWLSKKEWLSKMDFRCYKDGKEITIDARKNPNSCRKKDVDFFITRKNDEFILISSKMEDRLEKRNSTGITIELGKIQNRIVDLYKSKNSLKTKTEAINDMILKYGEEFTEEEINRDWKQDPATPKQISYLKSLDIKIPKNLTKFEASEIIKEMEVKHG